ncbi:MAG TPA: hypothetical protein VEM13_07750 [Gemmatimonadales bacterium]|nr:hypothetical protein [Gemmatimonadales bacterium]
MPAVVVVGTATAVAAQDGKPEKGPLVLKAQGSFFVGGETKNVGPNNDYTIHQMYVQYMIPVGKTGVPVVMVHGCCLSSKSWQQTPDGRMGWDEYFVRQGHPTYLADQVSRARSGYDETVINQVKAGTLPPSSLPSIFRIGHQGTWTGFRFGPAFGSVYPDEQFPVEAFDEFSKQIIPDINSQLDPTANPTWTNMAALANKLGGAVLIGHSESSAFPPRAALIDPSGVRGLIQLETGCLATLTADQYATLARIPILIVVADHLAAPPPSASCVTYMTQLRAAGGDVTFIHLPEIGIHGNSHMMMLDKNNLQVADVLLAWIGEHVEGKNGK